MLVLTRKSGEAIRIGDDVRIVVVSVKDNQIKLGIEAPLDKSVHREEIYLKIQQENRSAATLMPDDIADAIGKVSDR